VVEAAPQQHPLRFAALVTLLTLVTCAALLVGGGNPALAVAPVVGLAAVWGLWNAPLRLPMLVLLFLALAVEIPAERPATGRFKSPFYVIGQVLFDNLNNVTGIGPLRFSGLDVLVFGMLFILIYRKAMRRDVDGARTTQTASCVAPAILLALLGVVFMEMWGLARGGSFKNSLWQMRQMLFLPLLTYLFQATLRGRADHRILGVMLVVCALIKVAFGLYVYIGVFRPMNMKPQYVTMHSDSMIYAAATVMLLARWNERRDTTGWLGVLGVLPVLMLGMIINNRRLVWVQVVLALIAVFFLVPRNAVKRLVMRAVLVSLPLMPLYLAAGWNSSAGIFKPAQTVRSLVSADADRSTATREIENFNLYWTLKQNPLIGTGLGHEYIELSRADDISSIFPQYRYIPHNSLLGLWAFGGVVGFTCIWAPLLVAVFLSVRSYRFARGPGDRTAALTVITVIFTFAIQAYGDMGLQSWIGVVLVAAALAVAGKLSVAVGAWPERTARAAPFPSPASRAAPRPQEFPA
jgi:O-antigen ligase